MVNKNYVLFPEYKKKFDVLWDELREKSKAIPASGGLDGPLDVFIKAQNKKIKALQEEYSFLFLQKKEDDENG